MLPRSIVMYTLGSFMLPSAEALAEALAEAPLKKPGDLEISSRGFVSPTNDGALVLPVAGAYLIASGSWERKLPQPAIKAALAEKIAAVEKERGDGYKVLGRHRRELKDEILREIIPKTLPTPGRILAFLDPNSQLLYVEATSRNTADAVVSEIRRALGSFPVLPINPELSPQSVLTGWIAGEPVPEGLVLGGDAVLIGSGGVKVTIKNGELASESTVKHLEEGLQVERLELFHRERLRITLDDGLAVRKIAFLDLALEPLENPDEEQDAFLSRAFIGISELRVLAADLATWFKVTPPEG